MFYLRPLGTLFYNSYKVKKSQVLDKFQVEAHGARVEHFLFLFLSHSPIDYRLTLYDNPSLRSALRPFHEGLLLGSLSS